MRLNKTLLLTLACATIATLGCDDDTAGATLEPVERLDSGQPGIDGGGGGGGAPVLDGWIDDCNLDAGCDAGVVADAAGPDAAEPDMMIPDAEPIDPDAALIDAGAACVDEACPDWHACHEDACRIDLRPQPYRLSIGTRILAPEGAAATVQVALISAIALGEINVIFEPGDYQEGGLARWYMGNGKPEADNNYTYRHNLPIQHFDGAWYYSEPDASYRDDDGPEWRVEGGDARLNIHVPAGKVIVEGSEQTCWVPLIIRLDAMRIWPTLDDEGGQMLKGFTTGFLRHDELVPVSVQVSGNQLDFVDFFEGVEMTADTDGDGVLDAYPFEMIIEATPIILSEDPVAEDGSNRDPAPGIDNPAECADL